MIYVGFRVCMAKETVDEFMGLLMILEGENCIANEAYPHAPSDHHTLNALMESVERCTIPDGGVLSSRPPDGKNTRRRLCPWPSRAIFISENEKYWMSFDSLIV